MSKSILIIDTPDSCMGCNFLYCDMEENLETCQAKDESKKVNLNEYEKPDWCPLKNLPEKKEIKELNGRPLLKAQFVGWNQCIDEIVKSGGIE